MKKNLMKSLCIAFILSGTALTATAQGIVVKKTDGTKIYYKASDVQSVGVYGYGEGPDDDIIEHPWVDLGLPTGTLWATCNIGAESPEKYGDYFAWGEIKPKSDYSQNTYKYFDTELEYYTKYGTGGSSSVNDGIAELEPEDDAATVNWGPDWQMPSFEQFIELTNSENTTLYKKELNGVNGILIVSKKNGNRIFLPVTGYYKGTELIYANNGYYWSRSLYSGANGHNLTIFPEGSDMLYFIGKNQNGAAINCRRYLGNNVRPVRKQ